MKYALILLFISAAYAQQVSPGYCPSRPFTGPTWTSATAINTQVTINSNVQGQSITVVIDQNGSITTGAITFLGDPGDTNFVTLGPDQVVDTAQGTTTIIPNPYTVQASTNRIFTVKMKGFNNLAVKLTTVLGAGSLSIFSTVNCYDPFVASAGLINCDQSAPINVSTVTTAQIIPISGTAGRTYICAMDIVVNAANNVALVSGSGTNCAANLAGLAGGTTAAAGWNFPANGGLTLSGGSGIILKTTTTNNEVCVVTSAASQVSGSISYTQF